MKRYRILVAFLVLLLTVGCNRTSTDNQDVMPTEDMNVVTQSNIEDKVEPISLEDFSVEYNGITLNQNTYLKDLEKEFGIDLSEGENIETRASSQIKGIHYKWNKLHYPNMDNEEIEIDYAYNEDDGSGRIVYIELKKTATARGVSVGDSLAKTIEKYGDYLGEEGYNSEDTRYYKLYYDAYFIWIIYDINSQKVVEIAFDYDTNQLIEDMDISLD